MQIIVRSAGTGDAAAAASVISVSFRHGAGASWSAEAAETFLRETSPPALRGKIESASFAAVAEVAEQIVGFALMPRPTLLGMLFVHPEYLRKGVGRALWTAARADVESRDPEVRTIELNATSSSLPFYRRLGFVPISREFVRKGARATRMALWLPARALGAELLADQPGAADDSSTAPAINPGGAE